MQIINERKIAREEVRQRKLNAKSFRLKRHNASVAVGPHTKGSPITGKEKKLILNLYQSYVDDGKSEKESREETARRLGFSPQSVIKIIKEMIAEGNVQDT